jgi:F-type H+-transporting ATPase subunit delta
MRRASPGVARRYGRALLDVASSQGQAAEVEGALHQLKALLEVGELAVVLGHPSLGAEAKKNVMAAVWKKVGGHPLAGKLASLLLERDRIALVPAIESAYRALWNQKRGVVDAEAASAVALDSAQISEVKKALAKATGKDVELQTRVDPTILGGLLVRMGGRTYDGTVKTRLRLLRERLAGGA